jgi:hypothetical protein
MFVGRCFLHRFLHRLYHFHECAFWRSFEPIVVAIDTVIYIERVDISLRGWASFLAFRSR